jgi:hypothetical protein
MNATDILRAALTAAGCFGAVYLALRYRVPGQGTGTRNAPVQVRDQALNTRRWDGYRAPADAATVCR